MKVQVGIDDIQIQRKLVNGYGYNESRKRALKNWCSIELEEFADTVGNNHHAFLPGHLVNGVCTEMQVFAIDFDNTEDNKKVTLSEILNRCITYNIPVSFAYATLSSVSNNRFRIVFIHESPIKTPFMIRIVISMLKALFPEADQSCLEPSRVFLGGKKLLYLNKDAHIALVNLFSAFTKQLSINKNYRRDIRSFCNKHSVLMIEDIPLMGPTDYLYQYDGILDNPIIYIIENSTYPSFFVIENIDSNIYKKKFHQSIECPTNINKEIDNLEGCQLLIDFISGKHLDHDQRFRIATTLKHFKGGKKYFLNIIEKYYPSSDISKWANDFKYMINVPVSCDSSFCPYYNNCNNMGTMLESFHTSRKVAKLSDETFYSEEEMSESLRRNIEAAIESTDIGIHIIKAQTGAGKTRNYIDLILDKYTDRKFIIAVPTNKLKNEIFERLNHRSDTFITPSVQDALYLPDDIRDSIINYHSIGLHKEAKRELKTYYDSIKDGEETFKIELIRFMIDGLKSVTDKRVIVTTHAMLIHTSQQILQEYTLIVDEDILQLNLLNNISSTSILSLKSLQEKGNPYYNYIIGQILSAPDETYMNCNSPNNEISLSKKDYEEIDILADDNLSDIAGCSSFVRHDSEGIVNYYCANSLPELKMIVLSATANEDIYRRYFKNTNIYADYEYKRVEYKGNIIQFNYHDLGRGKLRKVKQKAIDYVKELSGDPNINIITFKEFQGEGLELSANILPLYFGNSIGIDAYAGQSLAVIGTPFRYPDSDKLIACYLGANINTPSDKSPRPRRVEYNNLSFIITTYLDPLLRELQLYYIFSELEQCVGRARVLRNNCNVYVLSSFPCEQANIDSINYLNLPT